MCVLGVLFRSLGSVKTILKKKSVKILCGSQTWPRYRVSIKRCWQRLNTTHQALKYESWERRLHTYRETDARFHTPLQSASHTDSEIHLSPGRPRLQGLNEIKGSICAAGVFSYALLTSWPWHRLLSGACRMRSHHEECAACVTLAHDLLLQVIITLWTLPIKKTHVTWTEAPLSSE